MQVCMPVFLVYTQCTNTASSSEIILFIAPLSLILNGPKAQRGALGQDVVCFDLIQNFKCQNLCYIFV